MAKTKVQPFRRRPVVTAVCLCRRSVDADRISEDGTVFRQLRGRSSQCCCTEVVQVLTRVSIQSVNLSVATPTLSSMADDVLARIWIWEIQASGRLPRNAPVSRLTDRMTSTWSQVGIEFGQYAGSICRVRSQSAKNMMALRPAPYGGCLAAQQPLPHKSAPRQQPSQPSSSSSAQSRSLSSKWRISPCLQPHRCTVPRRGRQVLAAAAFSVPAADLPNPFAHERWEACVTWPCRRSHRVDL